MSGPRLRTCAALLDEACEDIGEGDIEAILEVDEELWTKLTSIESRMQELLILKDSPEKLAKETMKMGFSNESKVGECSITQG